MRLVRNWSRGLERSSPVPGQGGKGSLSRKWGFFLPAMVCGR